MGKLKTFINEYIKVTKLLPFYPKDCELKHLTSNKSSIFHVNVQKYLTSSHVLENIHNYLEKELGKNYKLPDVNDSKIQEKIYNFLITHILPDYQIIYETIVDYKISMLDNVIVEKIYPYKYFKISELEKVALYLTLTEFTKFRAIPLVNVNLLKMLSDSVDLGVDVKEDYNEPLYIVEIYNLFGEKLSENMKSLVTNVDTMTIQVMTEIDNEYLITLIEKNKSNNVLRNVISEYKKSMDREYKIHNNLGEVGVSTVQYLDKNIFEIMEMVLNDDYTLMYPPRDLSARFMSVENYVTYFKKISPQVVKQSYRKYLTSSKSRRDSKLTHLDKYEFQKEFYKQVVVNDLVEHINERIKRKLVMPITESFKDKWNTDKSNNSIIDSFYIAEYITMELFKSDITDEHLELCENMLRDKGLEKNEMLSSKYKISPNILSNDIREKMNLAIDYLHNKNELFEKENISVKYSKRNYSVSYIIKSDSNTEYLLSASPYRIYFQPLKDSSKQINILPKMLVDGSDLFNLQGVNKSLKSLLYNSPIKKVHTKVVLDTFNDIYSNLKIT